ncbi:putative Protein disulfide-isomerase [Blattamonas nauphoetae]|uniref:TXNDC16 N-terminal domain-containing protein n=1 Tax=Blattamonas nauphoetae TaxID=2049346 RepID=A0ABQ9YJ34_9EUKA|nr:putative Protein disulfide-isomerase [Blattamonas nauphoetae]
MAPFLSLPLFISFLQIVEAKPPKLMRTTPQNHGTIIDSYPSLIYYHRANDSEADNFFSEYRKAIKDMGPYGVVVAEANCTKTPELCKSRKIKRTPKLYFYPRGSSKLYDGAHAAEDIVAFVDDQTKKSLKVFREYEDVEELFPEYEEITLGYFEDRKCIEYKTYESVTGSPHDNHMFAAVVNPNVKKTKVEHIHIKDKFVEKYRDIWDWGKLTTWCSDAHSSFFLEFGKDNAANYFDSRNPVGIIWYDGKKEDYDAIKEIAKQLGMQYRHKIRIGLVDSPHFDHVAKVRGAAEEDLPQFHLIAPYESYHPNASAIYRLNNIDGNLSLSQIQEFIQKQANDELPIILRSAEKPEEEYVEGIKQLTGNTFNDTVLDFNKSSVILYSLPWGIHTKKYRGWLEDIVRDLKEKEILDLEVCELDLSTNDFPPYFFMEGFPAVAVVKKKDKRELFRVDSQTEEHMRVSLNELLGLDLPFDEDKMKEHEERRREKERKDKKKGRSPDDREERKKKYMYDDA